MAFLIDITITEAYQIFEYNNDENLEYGTIGLRKSVRKWLDDNVERSWIHSYVPILPKTSDLITFQFASKEDVMAFKLMWL